jgi:hypothetical protein
MDSAQRKTEKERQLVDGRSGGRGGKESNYPMAREPGSL